MKLSRAATYALLAAVQLSDDPSAPPIPCRRLAEAAPMPERFLLQVLRMLVNAELLCSTRGVVGGYRLARPAQQISLLDIIEAAQGPLVAEPVDGAELPPAVRQRITKAIEAGVDEQRRLLAKITLSELQKGAKCA